MFCFWKEIQIQMFSKHGRRLSKLDGKTTVSTKDDNPSSHSHQLLKTVMWTLGGIISAIGIGYGLYTVADIEDHFIFVRELILYHPDHPKTLEYINKYLGGATLKTDDIQWLSQQNTIFKNLEHDDDILNSRVNFLKKHHYTFNASEYNELMSELQRKQR